MTLWQDQTSRRNRMADAGGQQQDGVDGQDRPLSRREAREQERRAAEAAEGRTHPSGVVDFSAPDIRDLAAGGAFSDPNSTDIWEALGRRTEMPPTDDPSRAGRRTSAPAPAPATPGPATPAAGLPPVSDDLMERVRAAVLHRSQGVAAGTADPTAVVPVVPAPQPSRRELRSQVAAETTEDGLPASWFAEPGVPAEPVGAPTQAIPAAFTGLPEPDELPDTRAMPAVDRHELEARSPMTAPVNLPGFFTAPVSDDAITFSDQVPVVRPEPHGAHPAAPAPPAFVEPAPETTETDLAGFEALIRKARNGQAEAPAAPLQQPVAPQPTQQRAAAAPMQPAPQQAARPVARATAPFAEVPDDEHAGFSGLLSRGVTSGHGSPNALIMPDPQPADVTQAVSGTGDIFITGSHHLPRSLSRTGATGDRWDSVEMDRIFDASQDEPAAGVAPVRAAKAVSGAGSARAVVTPRRVGSGSLPTVLAVIAGIMAVGTLALLFGSWVLRLF